MTAIRCTVATDRAAIYRAATDRAGSLATLALFFGMLCSSLSGCALMSSPRMEPGFVDAPREMARTQRAAMQIGIGDVLELKAPDGSRVDANLTLTVADDGSVELQGGHRVHVAGKTLQEARQIVGDAQSAITRSQQILDLDRHDYFMVQINSDGVNDVVCCPMHGTVQIKEALNNETLRGQGKMSQRLIWIARPSADRSGKDQILAIDWDGIAGGDPKTNYTLRPGDFVFVADAPNRSWARFFNAAAGMK